MAQIESNILDETLYKSYKIREFDVTEGRFSGFITVYNVKDLDGDIIKDKALSESIENYRTNNADIRVTDNHNLFKMISLKPLEILEKTVGNKSGVWAVTQVDKRIKEEEPMRFKGYVDNFKAGKLAHSVGMTKVQWTNLEGGRYNIHKARLYEYAFTKNPANQLATVDFAKSSHIENNIIEIIKSQKTLTDARKFLSDYTWLANSDIETFLKHYNDNVIKSQNFNSEMDCNKLVSEMTPKNPNNINDFLANVEKQLKQINKQ